LRGCPAVARKQSERGTEEQRNDNQAHFHGLLRVKCDAWKCFISFLAVNEKKSRKIVGEPPDAADGTTILGLRNRLKRRLAKPGTFPRRRAWCGEGRRRVRTT
jgi:hypothetical protein